MTTGPIADTTDLGERVAVYRFSVKELLSPALLISLAVGGIAIVRGWLMRESMAEMIAHAALGGTAVAVLAAAIFALASMFFSVDVFKHGMRTQTRNGRSVLVRWSDISGVERRTVWGASYVKVVLRSGGEAWVPLWVARDEKLREVVRMHSEGGDPFAAVV